MSHLIHQSILDSARRDPNAPCLSYQGGPLSYAAVADTVVAAGALFLELGLARTERVAVYLEKRQEAVAALFGAAHAGGVFVPINPLLKSEQVAYILRDCNVRILVTSSERLQLLSDALSVCHDLRAVIVVGTWHDGDRLAVPVIEWGGIGSLDQRRAPHRVIDADMAAILYTSGSTGKPKGVVLSHRNMMAGAQSVAQYLENHSGDRILSVLPLSFDYGLSQLTTAFHVGACIILMNYLLPRDIISAVKRERITGLAAVPPLWIQLAQLPWPSPDVDHLRYFTNSGGAMPTATLTALRAALPKAKPYLMYGLTEAFRSTYLPPEQVDVRPDSIGKAIPNAEVMVVREDGSACAPGEPGELVHRGALVSLGYWNDPEKTAERFKPAPGQETGLIIPEIAVWSGDTVRTDDEGYLYFVSRRDEMIKTSGYRVSPTEVEEIVYASKLVSEAVAFGVPHAILGQAIVVVACAKPGQPLDENAILQECKKQLPAFMVPALVKAYEASLPRNPNGKIDRKLLAQDMQHLFQDKPA